MAKQYQWKTENGFNSDPDPLYNLSHNVDPPTYNDWQTADEGSAPAQATQTYVYYYRDSNSIWLPTGKYEDNCSSRVAFWVQQNWQASYDNMNKLTVNVETKIWQIKRDDIRGTDQAEPCRWVRMWNSENSDLLLDYLDKHIDTNHDIAVGVGGAPWRTINQTFVIDPGHSLTKGTFYVLNLTEYDCTKREYDPDDPDSPSFDEILMGCSFKNIQPPPVNYTVNYNANGGSPTPSPQTATSIDDSYTFTINGTTQWGHYKFLGWSHTQYHDSRTDADVEYHVGDTITLTRSNPTTTLYAVWMMDYRPGATLDTNTSVWKSHNRTNGACHVLSNTGNMTWQECRTIGGAEGDKGNPPLILTAPNDSSWRNQKLLGKE